MTDYGNALVPVAVHLAGASGGPLSDLTYAAKDNIDVSGLPTGNGNPEFNAWRGTPHSNATVIAQLQAAGATLVGKTHLHELAYGLTGVNPHYGTPANPLVEGGIPAGSSSGTAVAVARSVADFGLGSDTGGSVRVPAGYCGLYGWRPTHGLLSSDGVVPLAPSFDTVGVMARDLDVLGRVMREFLDGSRATPITQVRVPKEVLGWLRADVATMFDQQIARFSSGSLIETEVFERARLAQAPLQASEAHAVHAEWLAAAVPTIGADVARLLRAAAMVTDEQVAAAARQRSAIAATVAEILRSGTALLVPSAPVTPPLLSELAGESGATFRINGLRLTNLASLLGLPVINFPSQTADGLPVGMQLIGSRDSDLALLEAIESCQP